MTLHVFYINFFIYLPDVVDVRDPVNGAGVVVGWSKTFILWVWNKEFTTLILILKLNPATVYDMVYFLHNFLLELKNSSRSSILKKNGPANTKNCQPSERGKFNNFFLRPKCSHSFRVLQKEIWKIANSVCVGVIIWVGWLHLTIT